MKSNFFEIADTTNATEVFKNQLIDKCKEKYLKLAGGGEYKSGIVIWGTGIYGNAVLRLIEAAGIKNQIKAFCDDFCDKDGIDKIQGISVYNSKTALEQFSDCVFILANSHIKIILERIKNLKRATKFFYPTDFYDYWLEHQYLYFFADLDKLQLCAFTYKWIDVYNDIKKNGQLKMMVTQVLDLLDDDMSKEILVDRINCFVTGDLSYLENIPVTDDEYFLDYKGFKLSDNETFFDCGAYNGDTISNFVGATNNNYSKIIAFEPDKENLDQLYQLVAEKNLHNVKIIHAAVGNNHSKVCFLNEGAMGSRIISNGSSDNYVDLVMLDDYFNENPTYIKMDIEGAELDALKGAKDIITKYKPKLGICIYHKPFDFYQIPLYLKQLVPEYKFIMRQHLKGFYDLVLYAYV